MFIYGGFNIHTWYHNYIFEKCVAYAAMAKTLLDFKSIKQLNFSVENINGVLITDKNEKKTAVIWTVRDMQIPVSVVLGENKTYKGMDFLGNDLSFQSKEGVISLKLGQEPVYISDVSENVEIVKFLAIKGKSFIDASKAYKGEIEITNPYNTKLEYKLNPVLRNGWDMDINKEIVLNPKETIKIPFELKLQEEVRGVHNIKIELLKGREEVSAIYKEYIVNVVQELKQVKGKIVVDGKIEDWKDIDRKSVV